MKQTTDIILIGGGINGLLTAKELLASGGNIAILEKSQIGQESSWAGGGILLPIYPWRQAQAITDLVLLSLKLYPQLSAELTEATGIDPEWYDCGLLISKVPDIDKAVAWCKKSSIEYQTPTADFFADLSTEPDNPLWLPQIAQARNPRLLKSLKAFLMNAGVEFYEHSEIHEITHKNGRVTHITTERHRFEAEQVIITAGAWTQELLSKLFPGSQNVVDIKPVKGQMLLFDARPETLAHMVLDGDRYLIPRRDGKILAGSTVEPSGFEKNTSAEARDTLYRFATELFPTLKNYPVAAHWAGLRPGSPEGVPFIGRHPDFDNLHINAGHFRNGLVMGPASAVLLADLLLKRAPSLNPTPYQLDR